ncbi:MAG: hypothetical protein WDM92_10175 [Caulobacteraceae bacterium]
MRSRGLFHSESLDEVAATSHREWPLRLGLSALLALGLALNLGMRTAAIWWAVALAGEVWTWFSSRAQARGETISPRQRLNYAVSRRDQLQRLHPVGRPFAVSGTAGAGAGGRRLLHDPAGVRHQPGAPLRLGRDRVRRADGPDHDRGARPRAPLQRGRALPVSSGCWRRPSCWPA